VLGGTFQTFPGGKGANQAVAAARLGARAALVGMLGSDAFGDSLAAFLRSEAVDVTHVGRIDGPSGIGSIVVDAASQNTIVVAPGANLHLAGEHVRRVAVGAGDILVTQLEIPAATVHAFLTHGKEHGATTVLNPSPAQPWARELLDLADILILNETEAAWFAGLAALDPDDANAVRGAARALRTRAEQSVIVTLGERGAAAVQADTCVAIPARRVQAVDPTGAGDCFTGAFAARWAAGDGLRAALHYANVAASLCVQKKGAAPSLPAYADVEAAL
jgi:ribokinase